MEDEHITFKQVLMRILSVLVAVVATAACVRSLVLQINDTGDIMATISWFAGLLGLVAACAGYACTTTPHGKKNHVIISLVFGVILCVLLTYFQMNNLYIRQTIIISLIALLVQAVALVVYHFVLRASDPDAA